MFRHLILCLVLLTTAFAQIAALNRSDGACDVFTPAAFAQTAALDAFDSSGFDSNYKLSLPKPVQDKNFYLLSLFQRNREVRRLLSRSKALKQLAQSKVLALKQAGSCANVGCFDQLIRFDDPTIEAVATELQTLANEPQFK